MKDSARPLRGAVIGCGFVSKFHLEAWPRVADARLVALCDMNRQRLEQAAARVSGARIYTDAADLFAAEDLDFVEICTLPDSHSRARGSGRPSRRRYPVPEAGGGEPIGLSAHDRHLRTVWRAADDP